MLLFFGGYALASRDIALPVYLQSALFNARSLPLAYAGCGVVLSIALMLRPSGRRLRLSALHYVPFAALLLLAGGFVLLGERRVSVILGVAVPVVLGFWAVLTQLLGVFIAPWPSL